MGCITPTRLDTGNREYHDILVVLPVTLQTPVRGLEEDQIFEAFQFVSELSEVTVTETR